MDVLAKRVEEIETDAVILVDLDDTTVPLKTLVPVLLSVEVGESLGFEEGVRAEVRERPNTNLHTRFCP